MKILFLVLFIFWSLSLKGQDTIVKQQVDSSMYVIKLLDKTTLSGKIIERKEDKIIFNDVTLGQLTIPVRKIENITALNNNQFYQVVTHDGRKFHGQIISQDESSIRLQTENLGDLTISKSKIQEVKSIKQEQLIGGQFIFPNPHPTRYFFSPSAIPLEKGEGYFQNIYIVSNGLQYGASNNFSIGAGVILPMLFYFSPKVGFKITDKLYLGGGILFSTTFIQENDFGLGVGYGALTIGGKEHNFTINAGWGFMKQTEYDSQTNSETSSWQKAKYPMFSFSGATRLTPKTSLITENWFFPVKEYEYDYLTYQESYKYHYNSILSAGIRIMGEKHSFDIALAMPIFGEGGVVVLPYIDYVFKF